MFTKTIKKDTSLRKQPQFFSKPLVLPLTSQASLSDEKDTVFFFSVAPLDKVGGDSAYMDRIRARMTTETYRIVNRNSVSREVLSQPDILGINPDDAQKNLLDLMGNARFKNKKKVLYIGSRYDAKSINTKGVLTVSGSGGCFRQSTVAKLKEQGVKIVVCCLEFRFLKWSLERSRMLTQMFRDHIFLADRIVFLNQADLDDFHHTIDQIARDGFLKLDEVFLNQHGATKKQELLSAAKQQNILRDEMNEFIKKYKNKEEAIAELKKKGVIIPGIYTIGPLTPADLQSTLLSDEKITNTEDFIEALMKKPPNVLCLGLLRKGKGFEEAVTLAKLFEDKKFTGKVYLMGSIKSFSVFYEVIKEIFGSEKDYDEIIHHQITDWLHSREKQERIFWKNVVAFKDADILDKNNQPTHKFNFSHIGQIIDKNYLDEFCEEFYANVRARYNKHPMLQHIEIIIGASDARVKEVAAQCRYAIKFDSKGMADNASSIHSTLSMDLPTFTTQGLLTPAAYLKKGSLHQEAVILPTRAEYTINTESELEPKTPENMPEWVFSVMTSDNNNPARYRKRMSAIETLKGLGTHSPESVASRLSQVFEELLPPTIETKKEEVKSQTVPEKTLKEIPKEEGEWQEVSHRKNKKHK